MNLEARAPRPAALGAVAALSGSGKGKRLALLTCALVLPLLASCGGGDAPPAADSPPIPAPAPPAPPVPPLTPVPATPTALAMTYGVKTFHLAWGTVTEPAGGGSVTYRVFEDPDGAGPEPSTQIAGGLTAPAHDHVVPDLLHTRLNAQYVVQACNGAGCSALTTAIVPDLTRAIGYFKASNTRTYDAFGGSVALSADGNTMAVAASEEDSAATGTHTVAPGDVDAPSSGAVYVFVRTGGVWAQQAYVKASNTSSGDFFGAAVALSADGNTLAVGAPNEDSDATGVHAVTPGDGAGASNSGAVYVYTRTAGAWSQQAYVKASNTRTDGRFGQELALSGDGNTLAVVGSGAVDVYFRAGDIWAHQASPASSARSVALSADGHTLAVGAPSARSGPLDWATGAVFVYTRTGTSWAQEAFVLASNAEERDLFGSAVALSPDGSTLAVGAPEEESSASGVNGDQADNSRIAAGAAYVYSRIGGLWTQEAYVKSTNTTALFGSALALSTDGSTLVVGTPFENSSATGIDGNPWDGSATGAGAAYVYTRAAGIWTHRAYLKASNARSGGAFGRTLSLSGEGTLAVGSHQETSGATGINGDQLDNSTDRAGAVYLY